MKTAHRKGYINKPAEPGNKFLEENSETPTNISTVEIQKDVVSVMETKKSPSIEGHMKHFIAMKEILTGKKEK